MSRSTTEEGFSVHDVSSPLGWNQSITLLSILGFDDEQGQSWNPTIIWGENSDNKMEAAKGRIHKPREMEQNNFLYP